MGTTKRITILNTGITNSFTKYVNRVYFSLFHRAFSITKFYLYQLMHLFLSNTKIT